jgi:hypothetical protein
MIAWGLNYDRQLGLYKKSAMQLNQVGEIRGTCAVVEEMLMIPRLCPISLATPIVKVACGAFFTAAVTTGGELYTWGAGECGQLGVSRCTRKELPQLVVLPPSVSDVQEAEAATKEAQKAALRKSRTKGGAGTNLNPVVKPRTPVTRDIACGDFHMLALATSGALYAWGFNKRGQLGLEDTETRFEPHEVSLPAIPTPHKDDGEAPADGAASLTSASVASGVPPEGSGVGPASSDAPDPEVPETVKDADTEPVRVERVYASGHSSAMLLSDGQLFSWGSGDRCRTMQPSQQNLTVPTRVPFSGSDIVTAFAFSGTQSAAVVTTVLRAIEPTVGPQKSMKRLALYGCGFWDSEDIVVRFSNMNNPYIPARSCAGHLESDGVIVCKPPRLAEPGDYMVSISINGRDFAEDSRRISMYADPTINTLSPSLVDMRSIPTKKPAGAKKGDKVGLAVSVVGTHFGSDEKNPDLLIRLNDRSAVDGDAEPRSLSLPGKLLPLPEPEEEPEDTSVAEEDAAANAPPMEREAVAVATQAELFALGRLLIMTAQISLNAGTDLSVDSDQTIICHSFEPQASEPTCVPAQLENTVTILGASFIPPDLVDYEAVLSIRAEPPAPATKKPAKGKAAAAAATSAPLVQRVIPIDYVNAESLRVSIPSADSCAG